MAMLRISVIVATSLWVALVDIVEIVTGGDLAANTTVLTLRRALCAFAGTGIEGYFYFRHGFRGRRGVGNGGGEDSATKDERTDNGAKTHYCWL